MTNIPKSTKNLVSILNLLLKSAFDHIRTKNEQKSTPTEEAGGASSVGDTQTHEPKL